MFWRLLLFTRTARLALQEIRSIGRRLTFRVMMLFASACVIVGAIASLFWALHEVLFQLIGRGWGAIATSLILWLFAWGLWEVAWRVPLRPRRRVPPRRAPRRPAARSRH